MFTQGEAPLVLWILSVSGWSHHGTRESRQRQLAIHQRSVLSFRAVEPVPGTGFPGRDRTSQPPYNEAGSSDGGMDEGVWAEGMESAPALPWMHFSPFASRAWMRGCRGGLHCPVMGEPRGGKSVESQQGGQPPGHQEHPFRLHLSTKRTAAVLGHYSFLGLIFLEQLALPYLI